MSHITLTSRGKVVVTTMAAVAAMGVTACQGTEPKPEGKGPAPAAAASQDGGAAKGSATGGSATGSATGSAGGEEIGSKAGSAGGGRCESSAMGLRLGRADVGAGNIHYSLVFTNKGKSACTLNGFPGVSLLAGDGQTIGKPAEREGATGKPVTVPAGGSAHAVLHTINDGLSDKPCWKSASLVKAYPPGSKEAMTARVASGLRVCGDEFTVTAVTSGAGA
ncbi:DUF4232 domain-containing protein [Streptomyces sp. NPDC021098]|uniref:DUF4232 domain-containing protein n=1 Tax=unclassified Streptomyces TaxID=2593676 RepID=UPI0037AA7790